MIEIFWKYVVPQKTKQRITVLPSDTCTSNISERLSFNYLYTGIPAMVQCVKDPDVAAVVVWVATVAPYAMGAAKTQKKKQKQT